MGFTRDLPEDCVSIIISFTSPKDASRTSLVSSAFKVAADSDAVWGRFLPSDLEDIISQPLSPTLNSLPKKQLYLHLCDHPTLIANNTMRFSLEKKSGKKCYMIAARGLGITWGDASQYWKWTSLPKSRFPQVAELIEVWWLDIRARIETRLLSPNTRYAVFFIFKFGRGKYGFDNKYMRLSVNYHERDGFEDKYMRLIADYKENENGPVKRVLLDPERESDEGPKQREDGWMEIEMGEFFNKFEDDGFVVCRLFDDLTRKSGLVVEGIEFRPKDNV